ncbi:MAG: NADH-quinone oxidoreductase subunit NuoE [Pseudorhodobacter sp.]
MLRRLYHDQPESFEFTPANLEWARGQISKYPEGRQASAVIPLLWRAQEQEGWLSRPAIEHVASMLGMADIRVLEVATFYFMFQLQPVGSVAHIQICGTTSCMICGAEDLIAVCKELIASQPHVVSADGKFSWEEVECLGSCSNAPMAQIGKDYYEDLTAQKLRDLIGRFSGGEVPQPGPQNGRYSSEPLNGLTSLKAHEAGRAKHNASVAWAVGLGDTIKRIDGTEVPVLTPWLGKGDKAKTATATGKKPAKTKAAPKPAAKSKTPTARTKTAVTTDGKPKGIKAPRGGQPDDLKEIEGIGPKLEEILNGWGIFHFDQIAAWGAAEVDYADNNVPRFKGRASRDKWVAQAKIITSEGLEAFRVRARTNDY